MQSDLDGDLPVYASWRYWLCALIFAACAIALLLTAREYDSPAWDQHGWTWDWGVACGIYESSPVPAFILGLGDSCDF